MDIGGVCNNMLFKYYFSQKKGWVVIFPNDRDWIHGLSYEKFHSLTDKEKNNFIHKPSFI